MKGKSLFILIAFFFLNIQAMYAVTNYNFIEFFSLLNQIESINAEDISDSEKETKKEAVLQKIPSSLKSVDDNKIILLENSLNRQLSLAQAAFSKASKNEDSIIALEEKIRISQIDSSLVMKDFLHQMTLLHAQPNNHNNIIELIEAVDISLDALNEEDYEMQITKIMTFSKVNDKKSQALQKTFKNFQSTMQAYKEVLQFLRENSSLLEDNYLIHSLKLGFLIQWLNRFYDFSLWGASFGAIVLSAVVLFIFWSLRRILVIGTIRAIEVLFKNTNSQFDRKTLIKTLIRPISWILFFNGFDICVTIISYPSSVPEFAEKFFNIVYVASAAWFVVTLLQCYGTSFLMGIGRHQSNSFRAEVVNLILKVLNSIVIIIALLSILAKLGFNISALIASLGIGGLAVALAAKDILANFFASVMLLFDNAFSQGDWIVCGSNEGTVVEIGLRRTTIRTFDNALLFVPNSVLVNDTICNWNRRKVGRRIRMTVGVTYNATAQKLEQCIVDIKNMLNTHKDVAQQDDYVVDNTLLALRQDVLSINDVEGNKSTIAVYLDNFSDSSIDISISCFTRSVSHFEWTQAKQSIMLEIMRIVEKNGLSFAFPSQSVYVENFPIDVLEKLKLQQH